MRALLSGDHERLDALFVELLDEFRNGDPVGVRAMWARFEAGLCEHLDAEERYLMPLFAIVEPEEAAGLLAEHASLRKKLDELGVGVDLHAVSLDVAREFIEALRAHNHREDELCSWRKMLYRWAEQWQVEDRPFTPGPVQTSHYSRQA